MMMEWKVGANVKVVKFIKVTEHLFGAWVSTDPIEIFRENKIRFIL